MKILFLENRYKTFTFEAIGKSLKAEGYEIAFLVQNKLYRPHKSVTSYCIPFPKKNELTETNVRKEHVERVILSDRMQNFFQKKTKGYFYYYDNKIDEILESFKPDLVFGESTAFHELLTIYNCIEKDILYLNPTTCRYPKNRFSFYKYNTLEPFMGSGELLTDAEAEAIIKGVLKRTTKPDYMAKVKKRKTRTLKDKIFKTWAYWYGDSYNTPNPKVKFKLAKTRKKNIKEWDDMAVEGLETSNKVRLLYPLQLQPEANIDVWGIKHRDQTQLIASIHKNLPENTELVVKPNPKSKYEITADLLTTLKESPEIVLLKHEVSMDDVLTYIDMVITVTGTIAIESILSNIPVVTLVKTLNNDMPNCAYIEKISDLKKYIAKVESGSFPKIGVDQKISYLNKLNATSYFGRVSDPFSFENCLSENNMTNIMKAFHDVINTIKQTG